jgi:hypothetical protein
MRGLFEGQQRALYPLKMRMFSKLICPLGRGLLIAGFHKPEASSTDPRARAIVAIPGQARA